MAETYRRSDLQVIPGTDKQRAAQCRNAFCDGHPVGWYIPYVAGKLSASTGGRP
jgi:hypothetical protein